MRLSDQIRMADWLRNEYREAGNRWEFGTLVDLAAEASKQLQLKITPSIVRTQIDGLKLPRPNPLGRSPKNPLAKNETRSRLDRLELALTELYRKVGETPPKFHSTVGSDS